MIIESVLGNVHAPDPEASAAWSDLPRERVLLTDAQLTKGIQRLVTERGREVGLRLAEGSPSLRDGDVLNYDEGKIIVVSVQPTDVLVIRPATIAQALFIGHALGNRHLQAQFPSAATTAAKGEDTMVVPYDHTVVAFLVEHGVDHVREGRVLSTPFRHAGHTH